MGHLVISVNPVPRTDTARLRKHTTLNLTVFKAMSPCLPAWSSPWAAHRLHRPRMHVSGAPAPLCICGHEPENSEKNNSTTNRCVYDRRAPIEIMSAADATFKPKLRMASDTAAAPLKNSMASRSWMCETLGLKPNSNTARINTLGHGMESILAATSLSIVATHSQADKRDKLDPTSRKRLGRNRNLALCQQERLAEL